MRIFCTGTTGFVGKKLALELEKLGHDVTVLERYIAGRAPLASDHKFKTEYADLLDHTAIRGIISKVKPEAVFHLAAMSPVAFSYEQPTEYILTNFLATVNLAEACRAEGTVKHFLFAGSSEEYGNQTLFPIKETAELHPNSPYSLSKVAADKYLRYMWEAYEFPVTVLRPYNTYGRISDRHFVTESIIVQMLQRKNVVQLGDPEPIRDLMYVDDHVNAYLACFRHLEKSVGEAFNFGTGRGVSIRELVAVLKNLTDYTGKIEWNTIPKRPNDIRCLISDSSKAQRLLGWKAEVSLESGLEKTVEALRKHRG